MRAFMYKAKLLIIIYSVSAFLLMLVSAAIIKQYYTSQKDLPCLSNNYIIGSIMSYNIDEEESIKNTDVLDYLNSIEKNYIYIRTISNTQGRAVVYSDASGFSLPLVSGRLFQKDDYINHTNTIIISNELENDCIHKGDNYYYIHNNKYYEVIGIFQGTIGNDVQEPLYYVNLQAAYLQKDYAYGEYILDVNENSQDVNIKMEKYLLSLNSNIITKHTSGFSNASFSNIVSNASKMVLIIFGCAILVLTNSFAVSSQWISARKKDIAIRKLLGASNEAINKWIIRQYLELVCFSFFIGTIIAAILIKISKKIVVIPTIYLLFGDSLNFKITTMSFVAILIEGFAILFITLRQYNKVHIVNNVR